VPGPQLHASFGFNGSACDAVPPHVPMPLHISFNFERHEGKKNAADIAVTMATVQKRNEGMCFPVNKFFVPTFKDLPSLSLAASRQNYGSAAYFQLQATEH